MRGRAGSVSDFSVFPTEISVSGMQILPWEHFSPVTGMKAGWILAVRMASSCIDCCIFHIIGIRLNISDTTLRVTEVYMIGAKVKTFVFRHIYLVSRIWHQNSSPRSLAFSHLGNPAEISHTNPRWNSSRQPGSCELALGTLIFWHRSTNFVLILLWRVI